MLKIEMVNKFQPLIEKKAQKAAKKYHISGSDYAQELYLKLLEKISKNETVSFDSLYKTLYRTKPTNDDKVRVGVSLDMFTPQEEYELSLKSDEETLSKKVENVLEVAEKVLTPCEFQVLSLLRTGTSHNKIGKIMGMSFTKVERVLRNALCNLNQKNIKLMLDDVFYDDNNTNIKLMAAAQESLQPKKNMPALTYNYDEIWASVIKNFGKLNIRKELDTLLRTQTTCKELLNDKATQTKIRKRIKENPDFRIVLKLDRKCNNDRFINGAKNISLRLLGKNVFKFIV